MIVTDSRVVAYVSSRLGVGICEPCTAMGIEKDGKIVAGAVFNCWTGHDVQLTIASEPGAITRSFLKAMGIYVRDQLGCGRVTFETEQPFVIEMAKRLGAQTEGRKRNLFGPGRDGIVLGILKEDWRF